MLKHVSKTSKWCQTSLMPQMQVALHFIHVMLLVLTAYTQGTAYISQTHDTSPHPPEEGGYQ